MSSELSLWELKDVQPIIHVQGGLYILHFVRLHGVFRFIFLWLGFRNELKDTLVLWRPDFRWVMRNESGSCHCLCCNVLE